MGDMSDLHRGQTVGASLAETCVTKMTALLGVSRAAVAKVMMTNTNHGKTSANRNSD
jgi:hypothetical protein